jgi:hypothetical protein
VAEADLRGRGQGRARCEKEATLLPVVGT